MAQPAASVSPSAAPFSMRAILAALSPALYRHQRREQGFTAERIMQGLRRLYVDGLRQGSTAHPTQGG